MRASLYVQQTQVEHICPGHTIKLFLQFTQSFTRTVEARNVWYIREDTPGGQYTVYPSDQGMAFGRDCSSASASLTLSRVTELLDGLRHTV